MAIRDIITLGYGNGTYSPGVSKLPTLGYSIGAPVVIPVIDMEGSRPIGRTISKSRSAGRIISKPGKLTT